LAFYTDLAESYDVLFPVSAAQRAFFDSLLLEPVRRVVDAGCGTGAQLAHFAARGAVCEGFDPDPALAERARRRLAGFPGARVAVGGFAEMRRLVPPGADLVLCLGNSLVHVPQEEAARFLGDAAAILAPRGRLALQILNYERLAAHGVTELPAVAAPDGTAVLERRYVWEGPRRVRFRTTLRRPGAQGGEARENEILLYPLYPGEVRGFLADAGFGRFEFFGDFARSGFHSDSEALVCLARKE